MVINDRLEGAGQIGGTGAHCNPLREQTETAQVLSVTEACRVFGVGRSFLFEQLKRGALKAKKAGRRTLLARSELERWFRDLPDVKPGGVPQPPTE
jgi:excisionase family DNA binding protein